MATKDFDHFARQLAKATYTALEKDKYNGVRYNIRIVESGLEVPLRLPGCFLQMGPLHREEGYLYAWPETPTDDDFVQFERSVNALEDSVKDELYGKYEEYSPLIKSDKRNGITIKTYTAKDSKQITSRFVDSSGAPIDANTDDRFVAKNVSRSIYPIVNVDSVYVSADKKSLSVQLKLAEGVVFFSEVKSVLDLDMINRMRAMKLGKKGKK